MWDVPDVSRASRRLTQTRIFNGSTLPLRSNTLTTLTALTPRRPTFHSLLISLHVKVRSSLGFLASGWSVTNSRCLSLKVDQTSNMYESDQTEATGFTDAVRH